MIGVDAAITTWINHWAGRVPPVDFIMTWISIVGVPLLVLVVVMQWWIPHRDRSTRHVLVAAGLSFLLGLSINQVILLFIQRVRPYDSNVTHLIIDRSVDFSFPSDHAAAGFAIVAAFLLHGFPRRGLLFAAVALMLAVSRVYVGIHYVGDVAGGALTGIAAAFIIRAVYRKNTQADRLITGIL